MGRPGRGGPRVISRVVVGRCWRSLSPRPDRIRGGRRARWDEVLSRLGCRCSRLCRGRSLPCRRLLPGRGFRCRDSVRRRCERLGEPEARGRARRPSVRAVGGRVRRRDRRGQGSAPGRCERVAVRRGVGERSEDVVAENTVGYWWRKTKRDAGIDGIRLHDLRHFFASGLIAAGCDVVTVKRALGHSTATTTLNTYSHLWPTAEDRTRRAADAEAAATGKPAKGASPAAK